MYNNPSAHLFYREPYDIPTTSLPITPIRRGSSNEVTRLQAGGYLVRAGFVAPAGLKAGV